jgi:superfamily II DNA or RNA helicase
MAKKTKGTYLENHGKTLKRVIDDYDSRRNSLFEDEFVFFNNIELGITKHSLRHYQMEALYILDYLLKIPNNRPERLLLLEEINEKDKSQAPFLTFEMATGSGKTMLMGASIYLLNKKQGIKNFLIITPASTDIYQKTIRNFSLGNIESVWADDTPFSFNLITGDNFRENIDLNETKDANIFVFNISKFGSNAIYTEKAWESSTWKDDEGNSIGIKEYLKNKKLIIITDEAHHAQSPTAKKIIKNFHPRAVLEYTATALEEEKNEDKKNQQIVYKYDIRRFLEDGHGKLVRAVAMASESKKNKDEIPQTEKQKIISIFMIHLLKKKAILLDPKSKKVKPLAFIKVKEDTKYTEKIFSYIKNELSSDTANLNIIIEKIKLQELDITDLLNSMYNKDFKNNLPLLSKEIQKIANTAIFYHGKSNTETIKKFNEIKENEVEIVIYMQRLDEGIDMPNIYTMGVINDTQSNFKTSVKQIIGRGVRLNKNSREFDNSNDSLIQQVEKLHIVCDQGKNFQEIIEGIQKEFGLNNKYFSSEKPKKPTFNKSKKDLLKNKYIPHIKAVFKVKEGINLVGLIQDTKTIITNYLESNTFKNETGKKLYFKYQPNSFFIEVNVFSDRSEFLEQMRTSGGEERILTLSEKQAASSYAIVQKNLFCLPDTSTVKDAFKDYIKNINDRSLTYFGIDDSDDELVRNQFVSSFAHFYKNHIEKNYYNLKFEEVDPNHHWDLPNHFKDVELKIPSDQLKNMALKKIKEEPNKPKRRKSVINLIDQGFNFYGFEKSIYDYDNFDSYPEFQLADYVNEQLKRHENNQNYFWLRNQRNIHFSYGSKKYYPDFIVYRNGYIYVIETKGEIYSDTRKNFLLKKLDHVAGEGDIKGFKGLLIFSKQLDDLDYIYKNFDQFVIESEDVFIKMQTLSDLAESPSDEDKFKKYLPVYSPQKAYKKFIKENKSVKPDGWLKVIENTRGYPKELFVTQVKGDTLSPKYEHNQWIFLMPFKDSTSAEGQITLAYSEGIDDGYTPNYILRKLKYKEIRHPGNLLIEKRAEFIPENTNLASIEFEDPEGAFKVIGIEYLVK